MISLDDMERVKSKFVKGGRHEDVSLAPLLAVYLINNISKKRETEATTVNCLKTKHHWYIEWKLA